MILHSNINNEHIESKETRMPPDAASASIKCYALKCVTLNLRIHSDMRN